MGNYRTSINDIDKDKFEKLVSLGLSDEEIANFFKITTGKLWKWVKIAYKTNKPMVELKSLRASAKAMFLAEQRSLARKSHILSIWIGKNIFDQSDSKREEVRENDIEDLTPLADLLKLNENEVMTMPKPDESESVTSEENEENDKE